MLKYCDTRDEIQKKTFTKWINSNLQKQKRKLVTDLYEDLRNGLSFLDLLEVLNHTTFQRDKGRLHFHHAANVNRGLDYLQNPLNVKLVNIRATDIVSGNPKLTLGLIWSIISLTSIQNIIIQDDDGDGGEAHVTSGRDALLIWAQKHVDGYDGVKVNNLNKDWRNGKVLSAIIHRHRPDLIDMSTLDDMSNTEVLDQAFQIAEDEFGVPRYLEAEDMDLAEPDERSLITYISALFPSTKECPPLPMKEEEEEEEEEVVVNEYQEEYELKRSEFKLMFKRLKATLEAHLSGGDDDAVNNNEHGDVTSNDDTATSSRHVTSIQLIRKRILDLEKFRGGELLDNEADMKKIVDIFNSLRSLEHDHDVVATTGDGDDETADDGDYDESRLNDLMKTWEHVIAGSNKKLENLKKQQKKLKVQGRNERRLARVHERYAKLQADHLDNLFMSFTVERIQQDIDQLQVLATRVDEQVTSSSSSSSANSSSSSSGNDSSSANDDVTNNNNFNLEVARVTDEKRKYFQENLQIK